MFEPSKKYFCTLHFIVVKVAKKCSTTALELWLQNSILAANWFLKLQQITNLKKKKKKLQ